VGDSDPNPQVFEIEKSTRNHTGLFLRVTQTHGSTHESSDPRLDRSGPPLPPLRRHLTLPSQSQEALPHTVPDAVLATHIVFLEHDALDYRRHVEANLPALLDKHIARCLHQGQNDQPTEDTCNVHAIALGIWFHQVFFLRSHSTLVDLTLFLSDAPHVFGLRPPAIAQSASIAYIA
jgi:hypothetical protein